MCCSFLKSIIKALKYQFAETTIIGCNFYLQKVLRRKMQNSGIPAGLLARCRLFP
ncbi:hypothetical protein MXB_3052 [Myxobolus squamalis]|nr:hypothetical protein MXB_3052 [Myxobolus squamalis]